MRSTSSSSRVDARSLLKSPKPVVEKSAQSVGEAGKGTLAGIGEVWPLPLASAPLLLGAPPKEADRLRVGRPSRAGVLTRVIVLAELSGSVGMNDNKRRVSSSNIRDNVGFSSAESSFFS